MVLAFNVHGVRLRATVDTASLAQRLRGILGPFEAETAEADFLLDVRHEAGPFPDVTPDGMEEHWRGTLPDGPPAVCFRGPSERETLLPGLARMRLAERGADVHVAPGADWCLNLGCLLPALCEFLARRGHYVVHAGTLSWDAAGGRRALLLCGPSGFGKTTTALALAHAGMQLLTDDATFLVAQPPGGTRVPPVESALRVWGLPRPCKVHRRTVALMPWLRPHCDGQRPVGDEYLVELAALAGSGALAMAEPALVLFLEERNPLAHRLRPLDKVQAVARLANENVRAADLRGQGPAGDAFRALADMARRTPTCTLSVGPDLESLHESLLPLLASPR
ncbi:MAG TPA: hypothetical protein VNE39_29210 [Planctomycetota bacterium]|nr:hypothetical protein [Planctomycetota bacterium]